MAHDERSQDRVTSPRKRQTDANANPRPRSANRAASTNTLSPSTDSFITNIRPSSPSSASFTSIGISYADELSQATTASVNLLSVSAATSTSNFDTEERQLARQELRVVRDRIKRVRANGQDVQKEDIEQYRNIKAFLNDFVSSPKSAGVSRSTLLSSETIESANGGVGSGGTISPCKAALERLKRKRIRDGRSTDFDGMSLREMSEEKAAVKKELGQLKALFSSMKKDKSVTANQEDKDIMRELYNRYCELKSRIDGASPRVEVPESSCHSAAEVLSLPPQEEDRKQYKRLRYEKKLLQIQLHKYQDEFKKENGRPIQTPEDRAPIKAEYKRYKELRDILAKLEAKLNLGGNDDDDKQ
ncbi:hypothetical protein HK101_008348 [Irineochytrium annulatum]|nr:hypothetical protein HK101_008348 [Irineochytrium annulatum]